MNISRSHHGRLPRRLASTLLLALLLLLGMCPQLQAREVVLASTAWEPYIGPDLPGQGYAAEVAREALARSGHTVRLVFLPWARVVLIARQGKVDGYLPEYESQEVQQSFLFSDPFPGGPIGFFKRRDRTVIDPRNLDNLKPYRIGVVRGYVNTPEFDARQDLRKELANDDAANLRMLLSGRIDLMVADMHVGYYLARRMSPDFRSRIEFVLPALGEKDLFVCFPKSGTASRALQEAFNSGLEALKRDGTLQRLRVLHRLN